MVEDLLNTDGAQAGGWVAFYSAALTWILELLTHITINDAFQYILSAGGVVFIIFKIKSQMLDVKIKKMTVKEKEKAARNGEKS